MHERKRCFGSRPAAYVSDGLRWDVIVVCKETFESLEGLERFSVIVVALRIWIVVLDVACVVMQKPL